MKIIVIVRNPLLRYLGTKVLRNLRARINAPLLCLFVPALRQVSDLSSARSPIFVSLSLCLLLLLPSCSDSPHKADEGITMSGTVTLAGRTDYSGASVKLFMPLKIDTTLINLYNRYPGNIPELDQDTEFHWRQEQAKYETETASNGSWSIPNVVPGFYHVVVEADSFGWQIFYNGDETKINFDLKKAVRLSGTYTQSMDFPTGTFVQIAGNTTFETGTSFTIEANTIIEFEGDYVLTLKGTVNLNAISPGQWALIQGKQSTNHANIKLQNCSGVYFQQTNFYNIGNGIYINNCNDVSLKYNRFDRSLYAVELFNCPDIIFENNFLSNLTDGVITTSCSGNVSGNIITAITERGINSVTDQNLSIEDNVLNNCAETGLGINLALVSVASSVYIHHNDFSNNKFHIDLGILAMCSAHQNNFLAATEYAVNAAYSANIDTLDFKNNYWNTSNSIGIAARINDYTDNPLVQFIGYIIDYSDFTAMYINP
jgi:hypothetical protein